MSFIPYLHFDGTCAEALEFYAGALGAEPPMLMRYSEAPGGELPPSDRIMHGEIRLNGAALMASDVPEGMGKPQAGVSVMHVVPDVAAGARIFAALSDGATILDAYGPTFFAKGYGMLKDRFGTHWIIYTDNA